MKKEIKRTPKIGEKVICEFGSFCFDTVEMKGEVIFVYKNGNIDVLFKKDGERVYRTDIEFNVEGGRDTYRFVKK